MGAGFETLVAMEGESDDCKVDVFRIEIYYVLHIDSYFTNVNVEVALIMHMVVLWFHRI